MSEEKKSIRLSPTLIIVAVIAAVAPTITAVTGLIVSMRTEEKVVAVAAQVEVVHAATNSMKDALVKATRSDALQEGRTQGVAAQKHTEAVSKAKKDLLDKAAKAALPWYKRQ